MKKRSTVSHSYNRKKTKIIERLHKLKVLADPIERLKNQVSVISDLQIQNKTDDLKLQSKVCDSQMKKMKEFREILDAYNLALLSLYTDKPSTT